MTHLVLAAAIATLLATGAATAADMPIKARAYQTPSAVAPYTWTGFYLGGHIGGGRTEKTWSNPGLLLSDHDDSGFLGGGQVGFNYQIKSVVLGAEVDGSWANISGHGNDQFGDDLQDRVDWLTTVTGRMGFGWDRFLIYGKGGAAWTGDRFSFVAPNGRAAEARQTRSGWTAGAGIEYAMWDNWSIKAEYAYMDFGTEHVAWVTGDFVDIKQTLQVGKIGVNFRFGP